MKLATLFTTFAGISYVAAWGIPGLGEVGCNACSVDQKVTNGQVIIDCNECWGIGASVSGDLNRCYTNGDGQLRKGGGGWAGSCKDWSTNGSGVLSAQCKNKAGNYVGTSISLTDGHVRSGDDSVIC